MIKHAWDSQTNADRCEATIPSNIKVEIHQKLLESLDLIKARNMPIDQLRAECANRVEMLLSQHSFPLSATEKSRLMKEMTDEIFGFGPLEPLLDDPTVSDILVNGPNKIYIERRGRLESTTIRFRDNAHLMQVIQRIAAGVGRRIDESSPMLDARLLDGSRVNAIIPPLSLVGPAVSIRRFGKNPLDLDGLLLHNSLAPEMAEFLRACVQCRMNILISGGTGTGKTTILNVLSRWIPDAERVVTIEDAAELQLQREHVVQLEVRPPNIEGRGEVTQRELLRNSLRMRPDRIIIGEVRGSEALDMLQAMNTGHEGSMTTVHANKPRDALRRIENMVSMAGLNYPIHAIRDQMASALDLVIHLDRLTGGNRKITRIVEVVGTEGDAICLQELFRFQQTGVTDGQAKGHFEVLGNCPQLLGRLQDEGVELPANMFQRRTLK